MALVPIAWQDATRLIVLAAAAREERDQDRRRALAYQRDRMMVSLWRDQAAPIDFLVAATSLSRAVVEGILRPVHV